MLFNAATFALLSSLLVLNISILLEFYWLI